MDTVSETPDQRRERPWYRLRKHDLANRLMGRPLLRLMLFSFWFRTVVLLTLLLVVGLGAMIPRIWLATPTGFTPEVRVRLLNYVQCRALKQRARSHRATGNSLGEYLAWQGAWRHDPGDLESLRGLFDASLHLEQPQPYLAQFPHAASWLERLGATNVDDVCRIAATWLHCGMPTAAAAALAPHANRLPAAGDALYLLALIQTQRREECESRRAAHPEWSDPLEAAKTPPAQALLRSNAKFDLGLHLFASQAAWGAPALRDSALAQLRAARARPQTESTAFDLEFLVHQQHKDTAAYGDLLREMQNRGKATLAYQLTYAELLVNEGRDPESLALLTDTNLTPRNVPEAMRFSQLLSRLGKWEEAVQILERHAENKGWTPDLAILQARILIASDRWDELRALALELRLQSVARETLEGYSYFLESLADVRMEHLASAQPGFTRLASVGIADAALALSTAESLLGLSEPATAQALLLPHSLTFTNNPAYYRLLLRCADALKKDDYLLEAARRLHELLPNDLPALNNYAAALLSRRSNPAEAVLLTRQVYERLATSPRAAINHASALVQNSRLDEAEQLLHRVIVSRLEADETANLEFVRFEIQWHRGKLEAALASASRIDTSYLFPAQTRWLEQTRQEIQTQLQKEPLNKG